MTQCAHTRIRIHKDSMRIHSPTLTYSHAKIHADTDALFSKNKPTLFVGEIYLKVYIMSQSKASNQDFPAAHMYTSWGIMCMFEQFVFKYVCLFLSRHYLHLFTHPILWNLFVFVLHEYSCIPSCRNLCKVPALSEMRGKAFNLLFLLYIKHFRIHYLSLVAPSPAGSLSTTECGGGRHFHFLFLLIN